MTNRLTRAIVGLVLLACGGPGAQRTGVPPAPNVDPTPRGAARRTASADESMLSDTARYFLELAFGNEVGRPTDALRAWPGLVRVRVTGAASASDSAEVRGVIEELNAIVDRPLLSLVTTGENCVIDFVSRAAFSRLGTPAERRANGHVWIWWDADYRISAARILVRQELPPGRRAHVIREEVTQALGLLNDSWRYPDSMFYQGPTTLVSYSAMDQAVIRLLDRHRALTGQRRREVAAHLARLATR